MPEDNFDTREERAAAMRAELYMTHKVRGSLGTYYEMFPDEKPVPRRRENEGRER